MAKPIKTQTPRPRTKTQHCIELLRRGLKNKDVADLAGMSISAVSHAKRQYGIEQHLLAVAEENVEWVVNSLITDIRLDEGS